MRVIRLLALLRRDATLTLVVPHPFDRRPAVPVHQPQPHQVTLQVRLVVVLERGAVVQHRAVVEQERLAAFEVEADSEFGVGGQSLEGGQRLAVAVAERRVEFVGRHPRVASDQDHGGHAVAFGKHRDPDWRIRRFAGRLFAEPMQVKAGPQRLEKLRLDFADTVVYRQCAGVAGLAAGLRAAQAEHADGVAAVGVHPQLPRIAIGTVAHVVAADVDHVSQQIAERALRHRPAEVGAETEPRQLRLLLAPPVHRELPQQQEPAAVGDLVAPRPDVLGDGVEREVVAADVFEGGQAALAQPGDRRLECSEVTVVEVEGEGVLAADVGRGPGGRMVERPVRNDGRCHGNGGLRFVFFKREIVRGFVAIAMFGPPEAPRDRDGAGNGPVALAGAAVEPSHDRRLLAGIADDRLHDVELRPRDVAIEPVARAEFVQRRIFALADGADLAWAA